MRYALSAVLVVLTSMPAFAQEATTSTQCYPAAVTGQVEVTTASGDILKRTLLCIGDHEVVLAAAGRVEKHPLADVKRIVKPADGVADGFLKGVAVVGIFAILCQECGTDTGTWLTGMLIYGGIGAGIDALHGGREMIYAVDRRARPGIRPALNIRVRF